MAQPLAPMGDIPLLQQMLGLVPRQNDSKQLTDVVFVSIDCEAYEFNPEQVTEVGVSVLDTSRIDDTNPEITSSVLISLIESAHFRVNEYSHLRNKRFVKGNPDAFAFGKSIWIAKADAKAVLSRLFRDPANLSNASRLNEPANGPARNVVLVGHGIKNEIGYLRSLGFALGEAEGVVSRMDTSSILTSKKNEVALKTLLPMMGIEVEKQHLHNAGNDAAYTLHALLTIATKEHEAPGSATAVLQQKKAERAAEQAERQAKKAAKMAKQEEQRKANENEPTQAGSANVEAPRANGPSARDQARRVERQQNRAERRLQRKSRSRSP